MPFVGYVLDVERCRRRQCQSSSGSNPSRLGGYYRRSRRTPICLSTNCFTSARHHADGAVSDQSLKEIPDEEAEKITTVQQAIDYARANVKA